MEAHLFVVVDQLHRGASLITDPNERVDLARLSLLAGQKSKVMSSFSSALAFLKAGMNLLSDDDWQCHRALCLDLYTLRAEMEYIMGDFKTMKRHLDQVFLKAKTVQEQLPGYSTLVQAMIAEGSANDAISTGIQVLGLLGEEFPSDLSNSSAREELLLTQKLLSMKTEDELLSLLAMENSEKLNAMKFLNVIANVTAAERRELLELLVCRMIRLSLSYGLCNESAVAFSIYGTLINCHFGDYEGGLQFGKLALAISQKLRATDIICRVHCIVYGFLSNWIQPMQSSLLSLKEAVDIGLAAGDTECAMMSAHLYTGTALYSGIPLGTLYGEMKLYAKQMMEYGQQYTWTYNKPLRQVALNLLGRSADPTKLVGEEMDEDNLLENAEVVGNQALVVSIIYFYKMWLLFLFGEYELAGQMAEKCESESIEEHMVHRFGIVCNHAFYRGLIALVLSRDQDTTKYATIIEKAMEQMKAWASLTAWNCQHKVELLTAECEYYAGNFNDAAIAYDHAAELAAKHRFVHEEALSLERAGIFYLETGNQPVASDYFSRAHDCYMKWGACSKAMHLKKKFL
uniref:Anaphase-promoting complex subunit 5 n=2 Tax=Odontella aurita TaxID=265563 RepID=A0A7S4NFI6_9STRA|mmetsp:Transcript_61587/g.181999  ORF Transcript_61587/g.181999 Transcript_61587/m.181999 type:complete len:572 (+) Transcript_61587:299-2014(+)